MKETFRAIINSLKQLEVIHFNAFDYDKHKLPLTDDKFNNSTETRFFWIVFSILLNVLGEPLLRTFLPLS